MGATQFILVTAAGAGGPGFYLQTKGAVERGILDLGFDRVGLVRPGFPLEQRVERRAWEAVGQRVFAWISPVLTGRLSRYGPIDAHLVAKAIAALVGNHETGCHIHHNRELRRLGTGFG